MMSDSLSDIAKKDKKRSLINAYATENAMEKVMKDLYLIAQIYLWTHHASAFDSPASGSQFFSSWN